jgi:dCMP deaminase
MRPTRHEWAMQLALATANRATCLRRSVGCVLLNERGHVLATGYNGVASGMKHCNEETGRVMHGDEPISDQGFTPIHSYACPGARSPSGTNLDGCQAIHAEQNALLQCRDPWVIHSAYVTASPCITCIKLLLNTTCQEIYFVEAYPHPEATRLWTDAGRKLTKLNISVLAVGLRERS